MVKDSSSFVPDLWSSLEPLVCVRTYEPHAVLFEGGARAEGIYLIQKGKVRVWMSEEGSRTILIDSASPGTMLGLSETIAQGTHKVSAEALTATEVGFVPSEELLKYLRDHHEICMQVVRILSEDLHALYHQFQLLKGAQTRPGRRPNFSQRPM
jgi:CRP-like cAMP-binding protein